MCMSGSTPDRLPGTKGVAEILVATDAHRDPRPCSCPASPPADEPQLIFAITDRTQRASKPTFRTPTPRFSHHSAYATRYSISMPVKGFPSIVVVAPTRVWQKPSDS